MPLGSDATGASWMSLSITDFAVLHCGPAHTLWAAYAHYIVGCLCTHCGLPMHITLWAAYVSGLPSTLRGCLTLHWMQWAACTHYIVGWTLHCGLPVHINCGLPVHIHCGLPVSYIAACTHYIDTLHCGLPGLGLELDG